MPQRLPFEYCAASGAFVNDVDIVSPFIIALKPPNVLTVYHFIKTERV